MTIVFLQNKMDLGSAPEIAAANEQLIKGRTTIEIAAMNNQGIDQLEQAIVDLFFSGNLDVSQEVMVTNVRHITILEESVNHMDGFINGIDMDLSVDFLVIDLQSTWEKLGKITGETVEEDLLDQIFSKFCLGK